MFSFGISERKDQETNKVNGYSIPVCLWKKESEPNQKETNFLNIIEKVQDLCRDHLSREYGKNEATCLSDILYYKQVETTDKKGKSKKKRDEKSSPVLYVKLIYSSDTKKFSTIFRVKGKKEVKPLDYKDKYFNTRMAIIFDSIYLGRNSVSIQVKAHEVQILPFEERKSILEYSTYSTFQLCSKEGSLQSIERLKAQPASRQWDLTTGGHLEAAMLAQRKRFTQCCYEHQGHQTASFGKYLFGGG